jgi:RNA polymerase sigma-70 factor (ECF subfamily)
MPNARVSSNDGSGRDVARRNESVSESLPLRGRPSLEDVYREHFDFVYRVAKRLGGWRLDAEDVTQQVFLIVERRLSSFDATAQLTTWLYGITFNVVRAMRRRLRLELLYRADEDEAAQVPVQSLDRAELDDAARIADAILQTMAAKKRDVFVLAEFEGLSCAEIATIVGSKEQTIWSRLHYARREFSAKLAQRRSSRD